MSIETITSKDLWILNTKYENIIVEYFNDCLNCKELGSIFENLSKSDKYQNIRFYKIDANTHPIAKNLIEKNGMPYITIYKKGLVIATEFVNNRSEIESLLKRLLYLKVN